MATPLRSKKTTGPVAELVNVTPALAEQWLSGNSVNRKIREAAVNQYASDMIAGRWSVTNDAICFSPDGLLLNGQHRLRAVTTSGETVAMLVMRNVPDEAMGHMDAGVKRTSADCHREELALLVKAWNYWRRGQDVRTLAAKAKSTDARIPAVAR